MKKTASKMGFTFVEAALVVALIAIIGAAVVPVGIRFYRNQVLADAAYTVRAALSLSGAAARGGKNDSSFGVRFFEDEYVIFEGASWAARDQSEDEVYPLPAGVAVSGTSEFVFDKLTGETAGGEIMMTNGARSAAVSVNALGVVNFK